MSRILQYFSLPCFLCLALVVPALEASEISFKEISGKEMGLQQIMEKWHTEEMIRQAGKVKSHGWWPWGLTVFDIDNDGDLDLMPTHHGHPRGLILKNEQAATGKIFFKNVTKDMGIDSRDLPISDKKPIPWDFDGDGFLDIPGWSDEAKCLSFHNIGGNKLVPIKGFTFHPVSYFSPKSLKYLDDDKTIDFAGSFRGKDYSFTYDGENNMFRKSTGKDSSDEKVKPRVPQDFLDYVAELKKKKHKKGYMINRFLYLSYITSHDLNGDGINDLIAKGSGAYGADIFGRYFLGDGEGNYIDHSKEFGLPEFGTPIMIKDLTGDGIVDIIIARKDRAGFYKGGKDGPFVFVENKNLSKMLARNGSYMQKIFPVDLDNDGDLDLTISLPREGIEQVYENKGDGVFKFVFKASGWDSQPIAICDVNNDGLMDIFIGGSGTGDAKNKKKDITLFINQTQTTSAYCDISPRMEKPNPYAIGAHLTVYKSGMLDVKGAVPIVESYAHPDAKPVHVGLGNAKSFDLKISFPRGETYELKNVTAENRMQVTEDGKIIGLK